MAGWSLWPPLEGEGTGGDRWPLRNFPPLVDSERNIVVGSRIQGRAGAEIRTFPDFGFIRSRLPTPISTTVRGCLRDRPEMSQ